MFNKFKSGFRRNATTSFVSPRETRETSSNLPPAPTSTSAPEKPAEAPSYQHADQQKGVTDTHAEKREQEDEQIATASGSNPAEQRQPKTDIKKKDKEIAEGNELQGTAATTSVANKSSAFNRYWKLRLHEDLDEVIFSGHNSFVPNALGMFAILRESGMYAYDNYTMTKRHPDYLDYAVVCYYSILFYVQILRAQQAAGKLSGGDRSFLNRFKDKFPFNTLPVSSILFPYFSTLVATLPPDVKYEWIIPTYATDMFRANYSGNFTPGNGGCFIQPMVPYMLRILRDSFTPTVIRELQNDVDSHFDDRERYIPLAIPDDQAAAAANLFGVDYRTNTARQQDDRNALFAACGVRHPFFANSSQLPAAAPFWRRSKYATFPYGVRPHNGLTVDTNPANNQANVRQTGQGHLDEFLEMGKFADVDWFEELIRQAAQHARFFDEVKNLSDVPTTSGNEPLIGCKFRKVTAGRHVADLTVQLGRGAAAANVPTWYPMTFDGHVASFYTTRAGVSREETLQAMTFGTNGSINVTYGGNNFTDHRVGDGPEFLRGDYWRNKQWTFTRYQDMNDSQHGVEMFKGWNTMFQEDAAREKPTGY
jgi:hypothetical protein